MLAAEEVLNFGKESLVVADLGRMIGAFQLDVACVRQVLRQIQALGWGDQGVIAPVQYQAGGAHGRAQAPHLDSGRHPHDDVGRRWAGAVALEAGYVDPVTLVARCCSLLSTRRARMA